MSRAEAADYDNKRGRLLKQAARWFAEQGYDRASMSGLAGACGVSKGLIYHYFSSKDEILAAIIREHLNELLDALQALTEDEPEAWLYAATKATLRVYDGADDQHQLQLQALGLLSEEEQRSLRELQRQIVTAFSTRIAALRGSRKAQAPNPPGSDDDDSELRALTMSLFGMLNWFYLWHRPGRDIDRDAYAALCARLLVQGSKPHGVNTEHGDIVFIPVLDLNNYDPKKDPRFKK